MSRHIVGTFKRVVVVRLSLFHQMIHYFLHITAHIRVGILVD